MRAPASASWTCSQCGRTVSPREPRCHCGLLRVEASPPVSADETASSGATLGRFALALGIVAAGGYGLYVADQHREARIQAAEAAQQDRMRLERAPVGESAAPPDTINILAPS